MLKYFGLTFFRRSIKPGWSYKKLALFLFLLSIYDNVGRSGSGADREIETFCGREGGEQAFLRAEQMPEFNFLVNNTKQTAL